MVEAINEAANAGSAQAKIVGPRLSKSCDPARSNLHAQQQVEVKERSEKTTQISQAMLDALEREITSMHQVGLRFSRHDETGRTVIRVINKDTKELIREIPPEKVLDLAARLGDMIGILFNGMA